MLLHAVTRWAFRVWSRRIDLFSCLPISSLEALALRRDIGEVTE